METKFHLCVRGDGGVQFYAFHIVLHQEDTLEKSVQNTLLSVDINTKVI